MTPASFARRTWTDYVPSSSRTLLLPLGSCEQHGPHLPLATDTLIATALVQRVADVVDVDVAPPLPYGASGEHAGFPGLLSLGNDALERVVLELLRSARATWPRVVVVSGHGGNVSAVQRALAVARYEGSDVAAWFPTWRDGDPHAGAVETSVMWALDSTWVRHESFVDVPVTEDEMRVVRERGIMAVSPSGVLGSPHRATPEWGQEILQHWVDEIVALVQGQGERT